MPTEPCQPIPKTVTPQPAAAPLNPAPSTAPVAPVTPAAPFTLSKETDRRSTCQPKQRTLGSVVAVDGGYATLISTIGEGEKEAAGFWAVGRLISITTDEGRVVGLIYKINSARNSWDRTGDNVIEVRVELIGEIRDLPGGPTLFSRGINTYPPLGSVAHQIRAGDLAVIHHPHGRQSVEIGQLSQDESIPAVVCMDDMLKRHFAIVGSTGTGKSTSVALLLRKIVEARPKLRVLILDPHNEYASAFPDQAVTISTDTLELPFWLFQQEEICEVIFRGRENVEEEIDALRDLIPLAKTRYNQKQAQPTGSLLRRTSGTPTITADTPIPYRMTDLFNLIEEEIGQLEGNHNRAVLKSLKSRLESLVSDPRYRFMFSQRTVEDNMIAVIGNIFRIPLNNKPITAFQLTGLPSEVVNSVVSVLCRMAFDLAVWSKGTCEVLVLCEEAHRYVPLDKHQGFGPARRSISRIAKEGRKYGSYLGIVTQRPGELDPTILSQCSTVFAMRLSNDHDQEIIRSAISDSSASTLSFLSSIGNREAIAFGEGIATPMRMRFADQPANFIPGAPRQDQPKDQFGQPAEPNLEAIINAMRNLHGR
ncbi:MAG TPA: DUF87 domain-containing protein [Rhizobiales bacterium]|nr:DUF87 domain-containing protein [Hyphomicrobiales bacterium]